MTGYELSRQWFDFAFENPEKINPNHTAMYFFAIEHCNRLGWKKKFGFPSTMAMEAMGVKSYNTYKKTLDDLVDWGFFIMVEKSRNQYSSNVIALSKNDKAIDKALDKAMIKHDTKQSESKESIDKQVTNKPINHKQSVPPQLQEVVDYFKEKGFSKKLAEKFYSYYHEPMQDRNGRVWKDQNGKTVKSWKQKAISVWMKDEHKNGQYEKGSIEHGQSVSERVDRIFGD